jgi:dihydrofolate reductase
MDGVQQVVAVIAAVAQGGVIGHQGRMPWHLPEDLRRFKHLTIGHHLIMGRRTFESIGRALPGRTTIVLSRRADWPRQGKGDGVLRCRSLAEALQMTAGDPQPFVVGGAEIYRCALPLASRMYITRLDANFDGDTHFPEVDWAAWRRVERTEFPPGADRPWGYAFEVYERIQ